MTLIRSTWHIQVLFRYRKCEADEISIHVYDESKRTAVEGTLLGKRRVITSPINQCHSPTKKHRADKPSHLLIDSFIDDEMKKACSTTTWTTQGRRYKNQRTTICDASERRFNWIAATCVETASRNIWAQLGTCCSGRSIAQEWGAAWSSTCLWVQKNSTSRMISYVSLFMVVMTLNF